MNRIKSLDGLRAISIIMVILGHAIVTMPTMFSSLYLYKVFSNDSLGVKIFFVISGYLITKLLIIERLKNNKVNIKQFYLRRALRIIPVFYLYIFVIITFKFFFIQDIITNYSDTIPAGFYLWNYKHLFTEISGNSDWFLGHFWSLSMEEQFYLLWPITFSLLFLNISSRNFIKIVAFIVLLIPILRLISYFMMGSTRFQLTMMLHTGGDAIMIGCLGALIENTNKFTYWKEKFLNNRFLITLSVVFPLIISPLLSTYLGGFYIIPFGMSLDNIFILLFMFWCIYKPSWLANFLNTRWMIKVGTLSYSLYIWQQLLLTDIYDSWFTHFPQNIILVFIIAFLSYHLVEKPILNLKRNLSEHSNNQLNPGKEISKNLLANQ